MVIRCISCPDIDVFPIRRGNLTQQFPLPEKGGFEITCRAGGGVGGNLHCRRANLVLGNKPVKRGRQYIFRCSEALKVGPSEGEIADEVRSEDGCESSEIFAVDGDGIDG